MQELDRIKAKIRALSEKSISNGCTEQEAMLAMEKVGELLEQYNLTMNEVMVREEKVVDLVIDTGSAQKSDFLIFTMVPLSRFTETKTWFSAKQEWVYRKNGRPRRKTKNVEIHSFGLVSDTSMFEYLYKVIETAYKTEYAKFRQSDQYQNPNDHRKTLTSDFSKGFFVRIGERLNSMHNSRVEERRKADEYATSRSVKLEASDEAYKARGTSLVVVEKERHIESEFEKRGIRLSRGVSRGYRKSESFDSGAASANSVNLNNGIGAGSSNSKQLA